ncbi:MAG TPA: DUF5995 family protein [Bryobacteraceae bacterium]|nr:DUF5995 family protein [Bryobacteraceae bacterium]
MFPYDDAISTAVRHPSQSISDVLQTMRIVDNACVATDGLKWFNWLYFRVTQAVEERINSGGFTDPQWLSLLDVQFANFYFNALKTALAGSPAPGCWQALFSVRRDANITRLQFALAGMNAHINHDLCQAIVSTCRATHMTPQHGTAQYNDYTMLNSTLDSLIDTAKQTLDVRLPGTQLPPISHLQDLAAGWDISAAREKAWINAEALWNLPPALALSLLDSINGFTAVISKSLLVPVPAI